MTREEKEKFFLDNMNLAYFALGRYKSDEDLRQVALMKLWECIDKYDSSRGEFSTYAVTVIKRYISSFLFFEKWITLDSGATVYELLYFIIKNADKSPDEIYELFKEKRPKLNKFTFNLVYNNYVSGVSYYEGFQCNNGEHIDEDYVDFLIDETSDFRKDVDSKSLMDDILGYIKDRLSKRDYDIFYKNIIEGVKKARLAEHYGVSSQRIVQIVQHGLNIGRSYCVTNNIA